MSSGARKVSKGQGGLVEVVLPIQPWDRVDVDAKLVLCGMVLTEVAVSSGVKGS